jgi:hypothetical protein
MKIIEVDKLYDINDIHTQYVYRIVETTISGNNTHQLVIKEYITDLAGVIVSETTARA